MLTIINEISTFRSIKCLILLLSVSFIWSQCNAQIVMTNSIAEDVLKGNYNPSSYAPSVLINNKDSIIQQLIKEVSADSLKSYLIKLESFGNRNTGSDTNSKVRGIGATRRWIRDKFNSFSTRNENRLLVSYLDFSSTICGVSKHRNVLCVLPGLDTSKKDILLVEAHMDNRCEKSCDTSCFAPGMDDNGSGTALVIELARVMSRFSYDRTVVFTTVTAEEQALAGGRAMAQYLVSKNIELLACLNNDVVGGIECGIKSSPPSCSPAGSIDSVNLRVFSYSPANDTAFISMHKQLARYVKLQQIEEINPVTGFNTNLQLQIREDRVGRGGDHIPFRQRNMRAIRFTSSNEHGDGSGSPSDRQHTGSDVLGYDLSIPPDGILDTFLIDFNYLRRNVITNGVNLSLLAKSPPIPEPVYENFEFGNIEAIRFEGADTLYSHRIGVRRNNSTDLYFDTVLTFHKNYINVAEIVPKGDVQLHVMNLDGEIESIPSTHINEAYLTVKQLDDELLCLQYYPKPSSGLVYLKWNCSLEIDFVQVKIINSSGKIVKEFDFSGKEINSGSSLDLSDLVDGYYRILTIVNRDELFSEALILQ